VSATLVDSNVLLDILTEDLEWLEWSAEALEQQAEHSVLVINPLIYAEVSVRFWRIEALDDALPPPSTFRRDTLPWQAAFLAGKCFVKYRGAGGARRSPLPDFYIGAHAAISRMTLLTRDGSRYRCFLIIRATHATSSAPISRSGRYDQKHEASERQNAPLRLPDRDPPPRTDAVGGSVIQAHLTLIPKPTPCGASA